MGSRELYYGDNLDILRGRIKDESIDLCYIDPPFNSDTDYNMIYNNIDTGAVDRAQAQAFVDTWRWDARAQAGYEEIVFGGGFTAHTVDLVAGLHKLLKEGPMLAYLVSMTLRITEIHRVLKPTGSFYLHCDPTASHYLKLVCDAIFCGGRGGVFRNEIIWCYRKWSVKQPQFASNHNNIFFYTKTRNNRFNTLFAELSPGTVKRWKGQKQQAAFDDGGKRMATICGEKSKGSPMGDWWEISVINPNAKERRGYDTQKPEALLERIIKASSNEGDVVLDAYCGCGTSVAVAEKLGRQWIGIDITYQAISVILQRIKDMFGEQVAGQVDLGGIPKDMASATALANKRDDRVRKEFEKWAILTYTDNKGAVKEIKGADGGIDGQVNFMVGHNESAKMVLQVKSGGVSRSDVAKLNSDRQREGAEMAVLITLREPSAPMKVEAAAAGTYHHPWGRDCPRVCIVTVEEMINGKRMDMPSAITAVRSAKKTSKGRQEQTNSLAIPSR